MRVFMRWALATGVLVAAVGSVQAVQLNPLGNGQVLLYPYYTVQRHPDAVGTDYQTLVSITNEAFVPQAVRVRFVESHNSRSVFEFNVFLWAGDVWTGAVFAIPDEFGGGTGILTRDSSCTAPAFDETIPGFLSGFARFGAGDYQDDGGPTDLARTREGQIEVFAMADLAGSLADASRPNSFTVNCPLLGGLTQTTSEMTKPTGKLRGSAALVDVSQGLLFSYGAEALSGFTSRTLFAPASAPGPSLLDVNDGGHPTTVTANVFTDEGMLQASYPQDRAIDAVSAALITDRIQNEFNVSPGLAAQSEWVLSFPTRRYYVDRRYTATPLPPFDSEWELRNSVILNATVWNRDARPYSFPEFAFAGAVIVSDTVRAVGRDANVLAFSPTSNAIPTSLLGTSATTAIRTAGSEAGWATLGFGLGRQFNDPSLRPAIAPHAGLTLYGIPAIGFGVNAIVNGNVADGVLANYGSVLRHARTVRCIEGSTECAVAGD